MVVLVDPDSRWARKGAHGKVFSHIEAASDTRVNFIKMQLPVRLRCSNGIKAKCVKIGVRPDGQEKLSRRNAAQIVRLGKEARPLRTDIPSVRLSSVAQSDAEPKIPLEFWLFDLKT